MMDSLPIIARLMILLSATLTAGGGLATVIFGLPALKRVHRLGALLGMVSCALYFASQAALLTGRWDGVFVPGIAHLLWQLGGGATLLFVVFAFSLFLFHHENRLLLLGKSCLLLIGIAWLSHLTLLQKPVLFLHLLLALIWAGVILPFLKPMQSATLAQRAHRFGRVAVVILPVLFVAGGTLIWIRTDGNLQALWGNWGLAMTGKLAFVMLAGAIGLRNKLKIVPEISDAYDAPVKAFRSAMVVDALIFLTILGFSAWLSNNTPV